MTSRREYVLGVCSMVIIAVGIALMPFKRNEPTYQGKALSIWLRDLDDYEGEADAPVVTALRDIGTNAIPTLLETIQTRDSLLRKSVIALDSWQRLVSFESLVHLDPQPESTRRWRGVNAFIVLGPDGKAAIPALTTLLTDPHTAKEAASALAGIGPETLPVIVEAVTNKNERIRSGAIFGLAFLGGRGRAAIPTLVAALDDKEYYVRASAAWALGLIAEVDLEVFAPLVKAARDPHWNVRAKAIESLGALRDKSPQVLASLEDALTDSSDAVRRQAMSSLHQLQSDGGECKGSPTNQIQ